MTIDNPAWRPAQTKSERLQSISHHFLGDDERTEAATDTQSCERTLPVLVAITSHPVSALQPDELVEALARAFTQQGEGEVGTRGWQLQCPHSPDEIRCADAPVILVFATASLEGIRLAYTKIKQLPCDPVPSVGVLLAGASESSLADRCYDRLASGVKRFLNISVHRLGHVPDPGHGHDGELLHVVEQIQDLWYSQSLKQKTEVTQS